MKKLLPFLSIVLFTAAACNTSGDRIAGQAGQQQQADTTGLAAFNEWKAMEAVAMQEDQTVEYIAPAPVQNKAVAKKTAVRKSTSANRPSSSSNSTSNNDTASDEQVVLNNESAEQAKAAEKKGWSKAAKGAVIGGVAGAAGGAAIHKKNRVIGAVVGAVIGAGGGYAVGRGMDKKDGRYFIPQ